MKYVKSTLLKCVIPSALICAAITMTGCLEKPKGTLNISTEPMGLEILVDDDRKGASPSVSREYLSVEVIEGERQVTATKQIDDFEEYFATKKVFVAANTTQVILISLGEEKRVSSQGQKNKESYIVDCDAGQGDKCSKLAKYFEKQIEPDSIIQANNFYRMACDAKELSSCYNLAGNIYQGIGADQNKALANSLYERSCEDGHMPSCRNIGGHLWQGDGIEKDVNRAINILNRACTNADLKSCTSLGILYISSDNKDINKASEILLDTCDKKEGTACYALGVTLKVKDPKTAKSLFEKGCEFGTGKACQEVKKIELAEKKRLAARKAAAAKKAAAERKERERRANLQKKLEAECDHVYVGKTWRIRGLLGGQNVEVKGVNRRRGKATVYYPAYSERKEIYCQLIPN